MRFVSGFLFFLSFCGVLTAQAPSFVQGVTFPTQVGPLASITGDFNGDGHADIAISNTGTSSISILLGVGDGTFKPAVQYSTGICQPGQATTGDFNRDGHLDLLTSCTLTSNVMVLPGKGDGTFGAPIFSPTSLPVVSGFLDAFTEPLTSADVNGDGILDLALIIQTTQSVAITSPGAIGQAVIMTGNGDGTFGHTTALKIAPAGTEPYAVQLFDMNGDGKMDIVGIAFNYDGSGLSVPNVAFVFVALGDGKGGFTLKDSYSLKGIPQTGMMLGDVNGDGKIDVVFAGLSISAIFNSDVAGASGVGVFLGNGDGSLTQSYATADPQTSQYQATLGSALAPILGSKYPDIIGLVLYQSLTNDSEISGAVVVRPNKGDGTFGPPQTLIGPSSSLPFSVSVGDFNSDGRPDIFTLNFNVNLIQLLFNSASNQLDLIGQAIKTFPTGTGSILLNHTAFATSFTNTNAANFQAGSLASSSIVTAFGAGLASSTVNATQVPLPTNLGGVTVTVTDSLGIARNAPLFYVSPKQINYAIPDGTAIHTATIWVTSPLGTAKVQQPIVAVAPGLFNASGLALGHVLTYNNSAIPVVGSTIQADAQGVLSGMPVDVGTGSTAVYLILYGTGIRNHQSAVTAAVGTTTVTTAFAGAQGYYVGEDQINLLLPQSLRGAGLVNLTLDVDGQTTNAVKLLLK